MHARVATIHAPRQAAIDALATLRDVDYAEIRLDALWPNAPDEQTATADLEAILAAAHVPLLATLRPLRQGGHFEGDETVRLSLLEAAARVGFKAIDVENDLNAMAPLLHHLNKRCKTIALSNHLPDVPATELGERHLTAMQDLGGAWQKLAFPAAQFQATLRAFELARIHGHRGGKPSIQPIGADALTRAALVLAGNVVTYGAATESVAAPNQPLLDEIDATLEAWGLSHDALQARDHLGHWYAVLGDPIAHSLSPKIHNAALSHLGLAPRYGALKVPAAPGMLRLLTSVGPRLGLLGCSVTAPHKEELVSCAEPDELAQAIGAANCVYGKGGQPHCTNTDATALRRLLGDNHKTALVLGAGGLARAAVWAAKDAGMEVTIAARDEQAAARVATDLGCAHTPWANREMHVDAVLQCTSAAPDAPLRTQFEGVALALECRYGQETRFAEAALEAGVQCISGRKLLVEQAADAFKIWTGQEAPVDVMLAAVEESCTPTPQSAF